MDRREFLAKAGLVATWAAISVKISGCSDDDDNPVDPGGDGDVNGSVASSSGHTHSVTISAAEIQAGQAVLLTLELSGHTHDLTLSAEQVMDIGEGLEVVALSADADVGPSHTHVVTFN